MNTNTVQYWGKDKLLIDNNVLNYMKNQALNNGENKFRYCFHENEQAPIHEMLFTNTKDCYFRPHKHNHDEIQITIDGEMYVVFFDDEGTVTNYFFSSHDNNQLYQIKRGDYHVNIPISDTVTIFEVKPGPFTEESNIFPDWAPDGSNKTDADLYIKSLLNEISHE